MLRSNRGFTLIEIIVVMAVFIVVIAISGDVFKTVLEQTSKLFRSEESNIEGIVGLEMFRHDLEQAGYGLFTEPLCSDYTGEAANAPASSFNEVARTMVDPCGSSSSPVSVAATRVPPRAVVAGNNMAAVADSASVSGNTFTILAGSDYLSLKGLTLDRNAASQKWTYLVNGSSGVVPKTWSSGAENLQSGDSVLLMRRTVTQSKRTLTIVPEGSTFYTAFSNAAFANYSTNMTDYVIYGLNSNSAHTAPRMPFNRSDYFVARPSASGSVPELCAQHTGTLYKATVGQSDNGKLTYLPLLDCVADMQVVFGWDLTIGSTSQAGQDGLIDTWSSPDPLSCAGSGCAISPSGISDAMADPVLLSSALKVIKVYVLAQVGRMDPNYTSPASIDVGDTGEISLTRAYPLTADMLHYRWKVYRIVVRPKNLLANI